MLVRIGFAAALLLTVQGVIECLAWRTPGLPFGLNYEPATQQFFIHDFSQAFEMARAVARGAIDRPYGVRGQLAFMELVAGRRLDVVMPYAYSPTSWLVLAPLFPFSTPVAYALWTLLPALALVGAGWRLVATGWSERDPFALVLVLIALISGAYQGVVRMGQTSLVLGWITFALISAASRPGTDLRAGLLLFLLTAKPPLALVMGVGLLWNRQPRPVLLAVALVVVEVACVSSWLGVGWISDYWAVLVHFNSETAPEPFRPLLAPIGMSNLRHLLYAEAGWSDPAASAASTAVWAAAMAWGTWLVVRQHLPAGPLRLAFPLLPYLLFCPHLTYSNDVMAMIPLWFLHEERRLDAALRVAAAAALIVAVNSGPFKTFLTSEGGATLAFLANVAILLLFVVAGRPPERSSSRVAVV